MIIINEPMRWIQDEAPWYMLFTDYIILINETKNGVNIQLKKGRDTLDFWSPPPLRLCMSKIKYLEIRM